MADLKLKFKADFDDAKAKANDYVKSLKKKMKNGGFAGMLLGGAVGGAVMTGVTKAFSVLSSTVRMIANHLKNTAVYMDNIAKASRRVNFSTDEFQQIQYAVERTGGSFENIERAYKKFQSQYSRLFDKVPSAEVKGLFEKLGITKEDMSKLTSLERFMMVSKKLMQVEDKDLRAGITNRLFGQGGSKMLPAMSDMNSLIGRFKSEEFGFSKEQLEDAERAIDMLGDLSRSIALLVAESDGIKKFADAVEYFVGIAQGVRSINKSDKNGTASAYDQFAIGNALSAISPLFGHLVSYFGANKMMQIGGQFLAGPGEKGKFGKGAKGGVLDADQSGSMKDKITRMEKLTSDQFLNVGRQITSTAGMGPIGRLDQIAENTRRTAEALENLGKTNDPGTQAAMDTQWEMVKKQVVFGEGGAS